MAEFCRQIRGAVHAILRHCRVQQKAPPDDARGDMRSLRQRRIKPFFADIAPGADDIGKNLDPQALRAG